MLASEGCQCWCGFSRWHAACPHSCMWDSPTRTFFWLERFLVDELVTCLAEVGLQLNVDKTKKINNTAQSPSEVPSRNGQVIEVLDSAVNINGTDACFAPQILATTAWNWHITFNCSNAFYARRPFWSTRMLQCGTVSGSSTPCSLLLLVSVLLKKRSANKICTRWILCFAGCYVPLLGHLMTWMGRCHGTKSFTIGMNEWIF